jgi:hypothetical protein
LNREQIAGPNRWKHARSPSFELKGAVAAKHLGRKTKLMILAGFQHVWHGWQQLRTMPVEMATGLGGLDFAAG